MIHQSYKGGKHTTQVIMIDRGYKPRSFSARREKTIDNRMRGMSVDVLVVFGKISEELQKSLFLCVQAKGGRLLVIE